MAGVNKDLVPEINLPKPNGDIIFVDFVVQADRAMVDKTCEWLDNINMEE